jgi:hypothetical protein
VSWCLIGRRPVMTDCPELVAAMRLLDAAKDAGFAFQRIAPGQDGPLRGMRVTVAWQDEIYLGGFANACHATRRRRWSLIVPAGLPVAQRVVGDALTVLHTVVSDWVIE